MVRSVRVVSSPMRGASMIGCDGSCCGRRSDMRRKAITTAAWPTGFHRSDLELRTHLARQLGQIDQTERHAFGQERRFRYDLLDFIGDR